jgi:hypothetical protein
MAAIALGLQTGRGADFPNYEQWVDAFSSYDVLKLASRTLSPVGVPVSHWSHAPGLVTNAFDRVLAFLPFVQTGLHTTSWLAALAFWWALLGLSRLVSKSDVLVPLLTLAAAFVGTHAGFYSIHHSSEIFALASFAVASFWAIDAGPERLRDSFIIGIACGLLLIIRVNLAMYVPLPLAARAFVVWRGRGDRSLGRVLLHAVVLGLPLLAFAVQLPIFNYWMTGSPSHSPYVYGDGEFRSVDLAHPLLGVTLFHAWHGLLTYHPLIAVGALALGVIALGRSTPLPERLLAAGALSSLLAHLYIQASWWCWWLGTGTYGNRTLALGGLLGVVALARCLSRWLDAPVDRARRIAGYALLGLITAACVWSFLLFLQGHSNFHDWKELLRGQRKVVRDPAVLIPVAVASVLAVGAGLRSRRTLPGRAVLLAATAFVGALAAHALGSELLWSWLDAQKLAALAPAALALVCTLALAAVAYVATGREAPAPRLPAQWLVATALCWIFVCGSWTFAKLAIATKEVIANGTANVRDYRYRSTMVIDDMVDSVREYKAVKGFEARKLAAKRFIDATVKQQAIASSKASRRKR